MGAHIIDGEFQSDKYPTTPRGKVPLSVKDKTAQDLLWEYAQRRRVVDAEFADDLETVLRANGYEPPVAQPAYKLFVWKDVARDWTSGIAFAVARNIDEAISAIVKNNPVHMFRKKELQKTVPEERDINKPFGMLHPGGG